MNIQNAAKTFITVASLTVILVFLIIISLASGAVSLPEGWFPILLADLFSASKEGLSAGQFSGVWAIVMDIRAPRIFGAVLAGGALAAAGTLVQGLFRNPLSGPEILGVSSGASLGAVIIIVTGLYDSGVLSIPLAASAGALGAASFIYMLARHRGGTSLLTVVLAGLALTGFLGGLISAFLLVARPYEISQFVFWTLGGLEGRQWSHLGQALVLIIPGLMSAFLLAGELDVMALGEEQAYSLGLNVERSKILILTAAAVLTAGAVSLAGPVGFIGLIAPHIIRFLVGPGHKVLVPAAFLGGAVMLLGADLAGRVIHPPYEIKAGIITALLGSPYFLWLVVRRRGQS